MFLLIYLIRSIREHLKAKNEHDEKEFKYSIVQKPLCRTQRLSLRSMWWGDMFHRRKAEAKKELRWWLQSRQVMRLKTGPQSFNAVSEVESVPLGGKLTCNRGMDWSESELGSKRWPRSSEAWASGGNPKTDDSHLLVEFSQWTERCSSKDGNSEICTAERQRIWNSCKGNRSNILWHPDGKRNEWNLWLMVDWKIKKLSKKGS